MSEIEISATPLRRIRSYVIRAGRMTAGQDRAWRELWPNYGIEFKGEPIDLDRCFARSAPRVLEIGFGTGDALLAYADKFREHDCLGIEVHPPGVGHIMLGAHDRKLGNLRVICHDAFEVLSVALAPASLDEVQIFFPDPWHKKRHHKRRLIQSPFVDLLARAIKIGGTLKIATDWESYAVHIRNVMEANDAFLNPHSADNTLGVATRPDHRPLTRFERRGHRLGHGVWDFFYTRK